MDGGPGAYLHWVRGGVHPRQLVSPGLHRQTGQTSMNPHTEDNLEIPNNLTVLFLDFGGNLEYVEKTNA